LEAVLDAEHGEVGLPKPLGQEYRAGVRIIREAADPALTDDDREKCLRGAMKQLQVPPGIFLPSDVTTALESARIAVHRAQTQR
jgi:hypothetical protein